MDTDLAGPKPVLLAKILSVLSVAGFWLLPVSPMIAIGAVSMTRGASGWSRRLALIGAVLCSAYTVFMALVVAAIGLQIRP